MCMEENSELRLAWEFVEKTGKSVFLTGKAGTGKTTFLRKVVEESRKKVVVVAPTGIAAINAGGVTIHSFFQLPLHPFVPGTRIESKFAFSKEKRSIIKTLDLLVIDEISMVRCDLLDAIDSVLRRFRNRSKPFGGVQLLMIGDLQQLTPVVTGNDFELLANHYDTPYFFASKALSLIDYLTIELKQVYRQQDEEFIKILNSVRSGNPSLEAMSALNARYNANFTPSPNEGYIRLTTHNNIANNYNEQQLALIDETPRSFNAVVEGNFPEYSYPTEACLELKVGAQVMFIKNDPTAEKRYFNGKIGLVSDFYDDLIVVKCPDDEESIFVGPLEWENTKYTIDSQTQEMKTEVQGIFRQYPLRLAWAITIHKSQGLSFDRAIIDAASAFASGQVYVALSRCRTLEGMVLSTALDSQCVISDFRVNEYIDNQEDAAKKSVERLESIKEEYHKDLLGELFDFKELANLQKRILALSSEFPKGTVVGLSQKHNEILNTLDGKVFPVALKWQALIKQKSFSEICSEEFCTRIRKGCEYFLNEFQNAYGDFLSKTKDIKAENKDLVKRYGNIWNDLSLELDSRMILLKAMSTIRFTIDNYLRERQKAVYEASGFVPKEVKSPKVEKAPKTAKTPKTPKTKKEDTKLVSFKLYQQGLSIKEISEERDYTTETISRHLAHFVSKGMISVNEFVSEQKVDTIMEAINGIGSANSLSVIKENCPEDISYSDIRFTVAYMASIN